MKRYFWIDNGIEGMVISLTPCRDHKTVWRFFSETGYTTHIFNGSALDIPFMYSKTIRVPRSIKKTEEKFMELT